MYVKKFAKPFARGMRMYYFWKPLLSLKQRPGGGGVTTIYEGTGCAILWGAFFRAENKFWGIILGKITSSHEFLGVIVEK